MQAPNVHCYTNRKGHVRYAIGVWVESASQYQAPLDAEERKLTGCHTRYARKLEGIDSRATLESASERATKLFGYALESE